MNQHVRSRSGILILAITLLFCWPLLSASTSIQDKWVKLGERTVNYTVDHSEIVFESLNANVSALRVKVRKGAINLHR